MSRAERPVSVLASPDGLETAGIADGFVVVVDVLRACTAIAFALDAGARGVIPVESVEDASRLAAKLGRAAAVLAGERGSVRVEGFDLGNSPAEFVPARVAGRTVVLSTTNGTRAFARAAGAKECVAGALVNRAAVARRASGFESIVIACAGDPAGFSGEDFLAAGLIVDALLRESPAPLRLLDGARAALDLARREGSDLEAALAATDHGRDLQVKGFGGDLALAAQLDRFDRVPVLRDGCLVAEPPGGDGAPR